LSAIDINDLTLAYGNRTVIADFQATIEEGEFIGIFGSNGSGKSTLFKALLGLKEPSKGNIYIFNQPVRKGNPLIGYMPQVRTEPSQFIMTLSGRARIAACINGYKWGLPFHIAKKQINELLDWVNARDFADRPFYQLSGGERQRILLAQALIGKPKLLLLDELLTNLDPYHQDTLIQVVNNICERFHVTVLFTAHDMNPLLGTMNRLIYIAKEKAAIGSGEEVVNNERLSELYDSPMEVVHVNKQLFVISRDRKISYDNINNPHH
jgi:zinc/manganese transport system ATP-binding protein